MEVANRTPFAFAPLMGRVNFPAHTATLVVKAGFRLVHGGTCAPLEEQPAIEGDILSKAQTPECLYDADLAHFKPRADLLLTGRCHVPGGRPATTCPVTFRVGDWSKTLACIGNRVWKKGLILSKPGDPEPFTTVDVAWGNAFGGPGFKLNPAGKGHRDGVMPNIEYPDNLIKGASDKPTPAGFGPIHRTWHQRTSKMGTYDKKWLSERFPAFPADFDWTYYNASPADQQLASFLRGDESIELVNLHPQHALVSTQLPGLRVRVLLREGAEGQPAQIREVPMNLDTLHVDAGREMVSLIWRGIANVSDIDWLECRDILIVSEPLSAPQPMEALIARFDAGDDDDEPADEVETPEQREERIKQFHKEVDEAEKLVEQHLNQTVAQAQAKIKSHFDISKATVPPGDMKGEIAKLIGLPMLGQARLKPSDLELLADPDVKEAFKLAESVKPPKPVDRKGIAALLKSGEAQGGDFSGSQLAGENLAGVDLSGCYFNGADLSGADLSSAILKDVSFIGANLSGANLTEADLSEADLSGADLTEAKLDKAKLDDAVLIDAVATGATFAGAQGADALFIGIKADNAVFAGAVLDECVFTGAHINGADFTGASLKQSSFDGVAAGQAVFEGAQLEGFRGGGGQEPSDFTGAKFAGALAAGSVWEGSLLKGADFSGCDLKDAQFPFSDLSGARFFGADLTGALMRKANLSGAQAGNANFLRALLEQADLRNGSFVASNFYEAEFLEASTDGADFGGANLKMTKLAK